MSANTEILKEGFTGMEWGRIAGFLRKEPVLTVSAVLASVSVLAVPPSAVYKDYIDVAVLVILFCFMAAVAGLAECGLFGSVAGKMAGRVGRIRLLSAVLVFCPYFASMFITNDMALITFVPLAVSLLEMAGLGRLMVPVIVLQTLAANLGSMLTPFGNPQNLLIFTGYGTGTAEFMAVTAPLVAVGTVLLALMLLAVGDGRLACTVPRMERTSGGPFLWAVCAVFAMCVLTVLGFLPYWLTLVSVLLCMAMRPKVLRKVDYSLLLTFVCLFVFTGNLAQVDAVSGWLGGLMDSDPVMTSVLASQFISNVPAAITLSGFTQDWAGLLAGVDIGGFGTPIASMASIISLKFYSAAEGADLKRYMGCFLAANVLMAAVLLAAWYLL